MKKRILARGSVGLAVLLALISCVALLPGCRKKDASGQGFRFPLAAEPRQIDPQVSADSASVTLVASLFEGLARLDENGRAIPGAADWTVSSDGLVYTFTLKQSAWSDGTPVKAADFVFGMRRAVSPLTKSALSEKLDGIKNARRIREGKADISLLGVEAVSGEVLRITLEAPNSDFPALTTLTPFMPCNQKFFKSTSGSYGLEKEYLLTNGPFYLKSWSHDNYLLIARHEGYHGASAVLPAAVRYVIGEVENPVSSLESGTLDAAPLPRSSLDAAKKAGLTLVEQQDRVLSLWMNNDDAALAQIKVRTALRDAVEWDGLAALLDSARDTAAVGFAPPDALLMDGSSYRQSAAAIHPRTEAAGAASSLAEGMAAAGLKTMPRLTLLCADDGYSADLARFLLQSWQKNLSLYFQIEMVSASELAARVQVGNYQLALYGAATAGPWAGDTLGAYVTGGTGNFAHFSSAEYDAKAAALISDTVTAAELEQIEKALWDACPFIPISFEKQYVGIAAADSGIMVRPFGGGMFGAPYDFREAQRKE